jgi:phosphoglycerate dehydrogenase-like enzyme
MKKLSISRVLIADRLGAAIEQCLREQRPTLEYRQKLVGQVTREDIIWADAYIGFRPPRGISLKSLKWIHSSGAGVDKFLADDTWPRSIPLTRSPGTLGRRMAEYCLARALYHAQRMPKYLLDQQYRFWRPLEPRRLEGSLAVVIGTGTVGSAVATLFHAVGCRVVGISRSGAPCPSCEQVLTMENRGDLLAQAQWIIVALPDTGETRQLLTREILHACNGAYLINVGRGSAIDTAAMIDAIDAGHLSGAALDVFPIEPLPQDSRLWHHPKIQVTPHISGLTDPKEASDSFLQALAKLEKGEAPAYLVDVKKGY